MSDQDSAGVISRPGTFRIVGDGSSAHPGVLIYGPGVKPEVRVEGIVIP